MSTPPRKKRKGKENVSVVNSDDSTSKSSLQQGDPEHLTLPANPTSISEKVAAMDRPVKRPPNPNRGGRTGKRQASRSAAKAIRTKEEYLKSLKITENDPAIVFDWHHDVVRLFVNIANGPGLPPLPALFTNPAGGMTENTFLQDVFAYLAAVAGGRFGTVILAPNTQQQALHCSMRIQEFSDLPFVQAVIGQLLAGCTLANLGFITDPATVKVVPLAVQAPAAPARQVFT